MDSIKELEKRWYFYKAKQSLLSLNAVGFVVMLTLGGYYGYLKSDVVMGFFNKKPLLAETKIKTQEVFVKPIRIAKTIDESKVKTINPTDIVLTSKNEGLDNTALYEVELEPVIPIVNMENESHKVISSKKVYHGNSSQKKLVKAKASTYLTASELSVIKEESINLDTETIKKINLNGSSENYIETMKKKFSIGKKPREALLLAKVFYKKGDYKNAEKWAFTANKLDSTNDESWHIFAKSKVKLGQKDEALRILLSYYKKSHSQKTKALIVKIKTERL